MQVVMRSWGFRIVAVAGFSGAISGAMAAWKTHVDLAAEIKAQFWTQYEARAATSNPVSATAPAVIELEDNYLVTTRLDFGVGSRDYDASDRATRLPWENFIIKPAANTNAGRIVAGYRVPTSGWTRVTSSLSTLWGRLPGSVKDGTSSSVFYVNLHDASDTNWRTNANDGPKDELGTQMPYPAVWERYLDKPDKDNATTWSFLDGHGANWASLTKSQPLSVAIGDHQLRFASMDGYTEVEDTQGLFHGRITFNYSFAKPSDQQNPPPLIERQTKLVWEDVPSLVPNFPTGSLTYERESPVAYAALASTSLSPEQKHAKATGYESSMRCTVFANQDYDPVEVGVASVSASSTGRDFTFTLNTNPWALKASNYNNVDHPDLDSRQRFRIWNAPEFLDQPGEMFLDTENKRLYFIPFSDPTTIEGGGGGVVTPVEDTRSGANQLLYVGITRPDGDNKFLSPAMGFINVNNFKIEGLYFRTATNEGIRLLDCNGAKLVDCTFQATGHLAMNLSGCKNTEVNGCLFRQSYHGALLIDSGAKEGDYPLDFVRRASSNIVVKNCVFEDGSLLYPSSSAVKLSNHPVGVTIGGSASEANTFQYLPGIAIGYGGTMNVIKNNTFDHCAQYISDFAAIYAGRSWVDVGNTIESNTFTNIRRYSHPAGFPSFGEDVAAIMLDDLQSGQNMVGNSFTNCDAALVSNGGRYNALTGSTFTNVDTIVRCAYAIGSSSVMADALGAHWANTRAFRLALRDAVQDGVYNGPTTYGNAGEGANSEQYYLELWKAAQSTGSYPASWPGDTPDLRRLLDTNTLAGPDTGGYDLSKLITAGYVQQVAANGTVFRDFDGRFRHIPGTGGRYVFINEGNKVSAFVQTLAEGQWDLATRPVKFKLNTIASTAGGGVELMRWRPFYYGYDGYGPIDSEK